MPVDTPTVGIRPSTHRIARVVLAAATLALALPQAAAGTVYDKHVYEELVGEGAKPEMARCVSALSGARVVLERYVDGYFVSVVVDDPAIAPNANPQETDEEGAFSWEVGEGEYRVSVTRRGYWRAFSGIVVGPSAVVDDHVALARRPGTPAPKPRDCADLAEPEPVDPSEEDPDAEQGTCALRPVNARVRGRVIRKVVFYLDGRKFKTVSRPDSRHRFGVTVEREGMSRGKHVLRAKVIFLRRVDRRPEFLRLVIRRCPERVADKTLQVRRPSADCRARPFLAWVRGDRIRRVAFAIDGRKAKTVSVADWRGRYGMTVKPGRLSAGRHTVAARIEFLGDSGLERKTVRLRFRKCA